MNPRAVLRSIFILLPLLISGILHANAGELHCRESASGFTVSAIKAAQPAKDKTFNGFVQTGFNDQIDDDGIDDDTIDNLVRHIAAACILLESVLFAGLKAGRTNVYSHSRFCPRTSRILFLRNIRI